MSKTNIQPISHREMITQRMSAEGSNSYEIAEMLESWNETQKLIPEDFDAVQQSLVCGFCADSAREAEGYAHTILAHQEPASFKALLGLGKPKFRSEVGSILPVYIPICSRCKSAYRKSRWLKALVILSGFVLGIAIIAVARMIPTVLGSVKWTLLTYAIAAVMVGVGYVVSTIAVNQYIKRNSDAVHFNIFDVDLIGRMREQGWFLFQDNTAVTAVRFSKEQSDFGRVFDK